MVSFGLAIEVHSATQKEGTIENQVAELKRQIALAGHVLANEYIDDGVPGPSWTGPHLTDCERTRRPTCTMSRWPKAS
jgi:hypothetical protein